MEEQSIVSGKNRVQYSILPRIDHFFKNRELSILGRIESCTLFFPDTILCSSILPRIDNSFENRELSILGRIESCTLFFQE